MSNSSCVLYVGAIPYNWDVEVIKSVVCGSGPIVDVRCMMDNASKNKGFCFVEYLSPLDALNALTTLSKLKIEGRKKLRIELSKEGLRNSVHLSKPVLKLNRLLLPANVILPPEMKESVPGLGLDDSGDENSNDDSTNAGDGSGGSAKLQQQHNTISTKDQDMELDEDIRSLKRSVLHNTDIRTMVSQMLANGMDLHQIASLITQFNAKNDANTNTSNNNSNSNNSGNNNNNNNTTTNNANNGNSNSNNSLNIPSNSLVNNPNNLAMNGMTGMNANMHNLNMGMNTMSGMGGINGMNSMGYMNNNMHAFNNGMQNIGGASRLLNSSSFLPQPSPAMQTALQGQLARPASSSSSSASSSAAASTTTTIYSSTAIPDPVSKTLSTIPPGVLVELLAKLKLVLSTPQPSANTYADAAAILNENPKLAVAAAQALLLMGVVDLEVISQANNIPAGNSSNSSKNNSNPAAAATASSITVSNPTGLPLSSNIVASSSAGQASVANQGLPGVAANIPPEWLSLPQHTVAKLLQLNGHEASLIFQVLQLSPDQISILPLNERNMANQIRSQYL